VKKRVDVVSVVDGDGVPVVPENQNSPRNLDVLNNPDAVSYIYKKNLNSLHHITSWRLSNVMELNNPSCLIKYQSVFENWPIWSHVFLWTFHD
jgi:hypothetical protein